MRLISEANLNLVEREDWGFSVHFGLRFQENSIYTYTYVLAEILQNGEKFRYIKAGFKNYRIFEQLKTSIGKPKKLTFDGLLSKKYNPPAKTWIYLASSNISTTWVKIHQITYVIFETISHFSQHIFSVSF